MNTIRQLEPHTTHEAGTHLRLHFRRDFGSFRQQRAQPQRMPEATRTYQHGDPLRSIDWRAYARTDQLLINQQQHSANANVVIAVSCVPAMHWPPTDIHHNAVLKLETALRVALHLAFMHSKILDHVTLCLVTDKLHIRKISSATEVLDIYENFCAVNFIYEQLPRVCTFATDKTSLTQLKGDAKYWLGDGLHTLYKTFLNDASLACMVHTLSAHELKSDWLDNNSSYFVERESGAERAHEALGKNLRRVFRSRLKQWLSTTERDIEDSGGKYLLLTEDTDIALYLDFLNTHWHFVA